MTRCLSSRSWCEYARTNKIPEGRFPTAYKSKTSAREQKARVDANSTQVLQYKVMDGEQLMMVPHELRQKILVENHDVPTTGHVGINRRVDLIKRNYSWRGIWGDVIAYVRSCPVCQQMKSNNDKNTGEL